MAHLTYARITGLAGRENAIEITFNRHVNVFYGVNGVGKTTLLKILHSAMHFDAGLIIGLPFSSAEVGIYSVDAKREVVREIKNDPSGDIADLFDPDLSTAQGRLRILARQAKIKWRSQAKVVDKADDTKFMHEYLPTTRLISVSDMASARRAATGDSSEENNINAMMEVQLQQQWIRYFSPLQGKIQDAQQKGIAQILSTILAPEAAETRGDNLEPEVAYSLVKSFLASHSSLRMPGTKSTFLERYQTEKNLRAIVNKISDIEQNVSALRRPKDQLQNLLNSLFLNKKVDLSSGNIKIIFSSWDQHQTPLRLSQLSSGEKQALYILIHALRAGLNSLIVDEPELSMHIDWQRQLIDAITALNPEAQIIMATHSPEIMATIPDKSIFEI